MVVLQANKVMGMMLKDPKSGKFVERPDSYSAKNISFRLPKDSDRQFRQICEDSGKSPGELAREIIDSWLASQ